MPIWKSPLFSDIRNAIEDNVVFSVWKGRTYFRAHVYPAQPRTPSQMAERDQMRQAVHQWQTFSGNLPAVAQWNELALPRLISGFNQFISQYRMSDISSPATVTADPTLTNVTITYTLGFAVAHARIYREDMTTHALTDITPAIGLSPDPGSTIAINEPAAGTFRYWIADARPLVEGDIAPQGYQRVCNTKPNHTLGTAIRAETIVT